MSPASPKANCSSAFETVNVHEILQRAYEICREEILAKNLRCGIRFARRKLLHVEGDPARLQQVFWNLIKNSVKFTPEGAGLRIDTVNPSRGEDRDRESPTRASALNGRKLGNVFNAFEQGQSSITRRFGGLGPGPRHFKSDGGGARWRDRLVRARARTVAPRSRSRFKPCAAPASSDTKTPAIEPSAAEEIEDRMRILATASS